MNKDTSGEWCARTVTEYDNIGSAI